MESFRSRPQPKELHAAVLTMTDVFSGMPYADAGTFRIKLTCAAVASTMNGLLVEEPPAAKVTRY